MFQFQYSPISTLYEVDGSFDGFMFQFQYSPISTLDEFGILHSFYKFQFQYSPISTNATRRNRRVSSKSFNSSIVRLVQHYGKNNYRYTRCFNSSIVRLVLDRCGTIIPRQLRFNSSIVRLVRYVYHISNYYIALVSILVQSDQYLETLS